MSAANPLDEGRKAFRRRAWADAYSLLSTRDRETPLGPEDLERLAVAAYLIGRDPDSTALWGRAYHGFLNQGNIEQAARCAFWLGMKLLDRGEVARGGGWVARAGRLIEDTRQDCVEQGFLLLPSALQHLGEGDAAEAYALFDQAAAIGARFHDPDLMSLARLGCGQALIQQTRIVEGTALLDEAMVAVESDELSPMVVGTVYCAVIEACQKVYDLRRAQEWTAVLSHWCDSQPDLIPYRGQCLVRRAEIMQVHGEWPDALQEVLRACELLSRPPGEPAVGAAFYCLAELHRLRGELSQAEEAYREASKWGQRPQPGLALLRLAQGRVDAAKAAILNIEEEEQDRLARSRVLPACVDIMLAADDLRTARAAADELAKIAEDLNAAFLQAIAARTQGAVLIADGEPRAASDKLRRAWKLLKGFDAPYETARTRVLVGLACRELGDEDTAELELDAAKAVFRQLGAAPDLAQLDSLTRNNVFVDTHGLTQREMQVLRLMAAGKTNKAIASELFISERTVDRHVSNIFTKLDVSSRAAATAYAYRYHLI